LRSRPHTNIYFKQELELFRSRLENFNQNMISNRNIMQAVDLYNEIRHNLWILYGYQKELSTPIDWEDVFNITQAGFLIERNEYLSQLKDINKKLEHADYKTSKGSRLLICGSIIGINDVKVLDLIRQAGGKIVADATCTGTMLARKKVVPFGLIKDPIAALAERYLYNIPCPFMLDLQKREGRITKLIREYMVSGVIYFIVRGCDTWRAEYELVRRMMRSSPSPELNKPILLIETDYSKSDVGTIKTKLEAFLEMIGGKIK